jgi:hypothetical protein
MLAGYAAVESVQSWEAKVTCIAAIAEEGRVWIGADSAGVSGWSLTIRRDPKVYRNGQFIFGFTDSFRMGQLLAYALAPPERSPDTSVERFMATTFVDAVRQCLKDGGYAKREHETETGGTFLAGYQGRLFRVCGDYQVGEAACGYDACGCGEDIARGSLFTSRGLVASPEDRLRLALGAAESFSAGVRGPFNVLSIGGGDE